MKDKNKDIQIYKLIARFYGKKPNKDLAKETGLTPIQLSQIAARLRKEGVDIGFLRRGTKGAFKEAVKELKNEEKAYKK